MIFAVMMVRNERDILPVNLRYHLESGIDHILVADNGSTDGTSAILEEFAATSRVHVFARPGPYNQAGTTTELAREAFLRGAQWVLPIDADEFWHVPAGRLADVLDDAAGTGALEVEVVNFVQRREQDVRDVRALLTMTRRVSAPTGTAADAAELVESGRIAFVECRYPPKYVSRACIALQIGQGNHQVSGTDGSVRKSDAIVCMHAPLRARDALAVGKVEQGRRVEEINHDLRQYWHVRRWRRLADEGAIDAEWTANSYREDCLDVRGEKHPLSVDTTLRDVVAPWIEEAVESRRSASRQGGKPRPAPDLKLDPADTAEILDRMRSVEGWLRDEEAELLVAATRRALKEHNTPTIVEVGSYCGKSTIVLASAARTATPSARVYAVDPHAGIVGAEHNPDRLYAGPPTFERFERNITAAGLAEMIEPIRLHSGDVPWRSPIAFLFIDGLHDYPSVSRDFFHFERHLPEGAYVAFHDCKESYPGVRTFVDGLAGSGCYEEVNRAGSLVVLRKLGAEGSTALNLRLRQQERGIAFLMDQLAARDRVIAERDEGIGWLLNVVRDKETTITELEKGVAWLKKEIESRDSLIEALRQACGR
jgi:glycosyltransferase involved in cell wall biosynthesis/predicted O-methyltransferase YrrM